jgi:DNA polymerase-3 subunit delta'
MNCLPVHVVAEASLPLRPFLWHTGAWAALQARAASQLPHALLLSGDAGIGKRRFADAFAAGLLCQAVEAGGFACGVCKSCMLVTAGSHPDLMVLVPEALRTRVFDGEAEPDGSGKKRKPSVEIRIDDVRALIAFAAQTSQFGGRRVVVIDPAQAMNVNAANALLKTLEEPGAGLLLLLVCDAPAALPATVRSRCQRVRLPAPARADALAWLAAITGDDARAQALLAAAGTPTRALALLEDDGWVAQRRVLASLLVDALSGSGSAVRFAEVAAKATKVADDGEQASEPLLLDWLPSFLTDAVLLAAGAPLARLRNADLVNELRRLVEARTTQPLFLLADDLSRMRQQMQSSAGLSRQLLWEEVLLRWSPRTRGGRV